MNYTNQEICPFALSPITSREIAWKLVVFVDDKCRNGDSYKIYIIVKHCDGDCGGDGDGNQHHHNVYKNIEIAIKLKIDKSLVGNALEK